MTIPLLCVNLKPGGNTAYENRALRKMPALYDGKGNLNGKFLPDFEKWFDDHIGFRDYMIQCNGVMQYYLFNRLEVGNIYLGPNGELAAISNIEDYQHTNLMMEKELRDFADAMVTIRDYLASFGCQFYFMQCWDKHSIYPEQYPKEIHQRGSISRAEQVETYLAEHTDINLVRIKERLIQEKENYAVYGEWSDPRHWNPRGGIIAYNELMNVINKNNDTQYNIICEDKFSIDMKDKGSTFYGAIHREELADIFKPSQCYAVDIKELFPKYNNLSSRKFIYMNNTVDAKDTILCFSDSYLNDFICSFLAESFKKTIAINIDHINNKDINLLYPIEEFRPNIVLFEMAERGNWRRDKNIIKASEIVKSHDYIIGNNIQFSKKNRSASKYVLYGLLKPGKDFTFMEGKKLVMLLNPKNAKSSTLRCKLSLAHVLQGRQPVVIKINDKVVYSGTAIAKKDIEFAFSNPNTYSMRLEIETPEASSPAELGIGQEKRIFPLGIREMKIFE